MQNTREARATRILPSISFSRLDWFIEDVLDAVFTPNTTPIINFAATLAWLVWLALTGYTILTTIPEAHWTQVGCIAVLVWCASQALENRPGRNK
jgi:hypothetical protein